MPWFFLFQVAISCIMSGYHISTEFSQYVIAAAFLPPTINPMLFGTFLSDFRDGYKALLKLIPDKVTKIFKGLFSVYQHHFRLLYHTRILLLGLLPRRLHLFGLIFWPRAKKGQPVAFSYRTPLVEQCLAQPGHFCSFLYLANKRLF